MRITGSTVRFKGIALAALLAAVLVLLSAAPTLAQDAPPAVPEADIVAGDNSTPAEPAPAPTEAATIAAPNTTAADEQPPTAGEKSVYLRQAFGWGMWPLWACSIILLALALERRSALKPSRVIDAAMIERVADHVTRLEMESARQAAAESKTVIGQAWAQGFQEFLLGGMSLSEALTNATALSLKPLKRNLRALSTLGDVSPLFGLLGTIVGMIIIFSQIAATGGADKGELAGGIGLALFTTAGGLIVAIPSILISRYFVSRLTGLAEQAESAIDRINYRYSHAAAQAQSDGRTSKGRDSAQSSDTAVDAHQTAKSERPVSAAVAAAARDRKGGR